MILIALIINSFYIPLLPDITSNPTTLRNGYANVQEWDGGTLVYAHNYLSGGLLYELEDVSAVYSNGDIVHMQVKKRIVYTSNWKKTLSDYSSPTTLTLVTCYPEIGTTSWRLMIEIEPETMQEIPWQKKPLLVQR